jgi:hypothetical protein
MKPRRVRGFFVGGEDTDSEIGMVFSTLNPRRKEERANQMKQSILIGLVLILGIIFGTSISPLLAQSQTANSQQMTCFVGESSNAACSGKWIFFAGNTGNLDESAWVLRVNSETGEIWYKNGKKLQLLDEEE